MSTIRRDFRASPHRTGCETWQAIAALLATSESGSARKELLSVQGIAGQIIATESVKNYPVISAGSGPRVRIYCVYDDNALDEDNANEAALAFDATGKDWKVSIPVDKEDMEWSKSELAKLTKRVTVREKSEAFDEEESDSGKNAASSSTSSLTLDVSQFLKK